MPYIDEENLQRLMDSFTAMPAKTQALTEAFLVRDYLSALAKEYAHQGVRRRLTTLTRCITQILPRHSVDLLLADFLKLTSCFCELNATWEAVFALDQFRHEVL
jgi:hypothetical protein